MYVGEHPFGLYALPSLVDQSVVTVNHLNFGALLIEGPDKVPAVNPDDKPQNSASPIPRSPPENSLDNVLLSKKEIDVAPSYPLIILGEIYIYRKI